MTAMAKIYGKAPSRFIRHPVTGQRLTVGNTNAGADLSYQEALAFPDYEENLEKESEEENKRED